MSTYTPELETDLSLVKRDAAQRYIRKRHLLRRAVRYGLVTPEQARAARWELNELAAIWRSARKLLRDGCALLKN